MIRKVLAREAHDAIRRKYSSHLDLVLGVVTLGGPSGPGARCVRGTERTSDAAGPEVGPATCVPLARTSRNRSAGGRDGCWASKRFATSLAPSSLCC